MLMDKGYYDYDYSEPKPKHKPTAEDKEIWSAAKLDAILGVKRKQTPLTPEQLQAEVMAEEARKRAALS
jgi:hypothetical protein